MDVMNRVSEKNKGSNRCAGRIASVGYVVTLGEPTKFYYYTTPLEVGGKAIEYEEGKFPAQPCLERI